MAKTDGVARIIALAALGKNGGGSTGGTTNYLELANKPKINNVELTGNKTLEDLGINIPDLENYYTKDMVNEALNKKQNTLTVGDNIVISEDNVISADLPIASADTLGGIKLGKGLSADENGVVSASGGNDIVTIIDAGSSTLNLSTGFDMEINRDAFTKILEGSSTGKMPLVMLYTCKGGGITSSSPRYLYFPRVSATLYSDNSGGIIDLDFDNINTSQTSYSYGAEYQQLYKYSIRINWKGSTDTFSVGWYKAKSYYLCSNRDKFISTGNTVEYIPTSDYNPATKKYVDDNVKTYTAGENIIISEDNVISASVSGGIDSNAVYTYYAPYSDDDWFTEGNVANILQTVRDKGYSNFELCTLNGNHYALRQGGNLQNLTTEGESYQLEYLQNDLKNYVYYFFVARLNEGGKIVVDGLGTQTYTAQEMVETYLPETLQKISGYDSSASHLILQSNNGVLEWDSSLDGGIFGDSYTDPAYYTEKQVDKIVTDTVNEALGGRY